MMESLKVNETENGSSTPAVVVSSVGEKDPSSEETTSDASDTESSDEGEEEEVFQQPKRGGLRGSRNPTDDRDDYIKTFDSLGELEDSEDIKPLDESELGLPISDLSRHIARLKKTNGKRDGFDLEFNYIENKSKSDSYFGDYYSAVKPVNRVKNRYSNVLPLEKSRVKLQAKPKIEGSDYINANWVDGLIPGSERAYISTQGPLQETVEDFWRMVWETGSNVIVMLTKEIENDKIKCDHYWPQDTGCSFTFEQFKVTMVDEEKSFEDRLITRSFLLENFKDEYTKREVMHFQYMDWPDYGLPKNAVVFRDLLHNVDRKRQENTPIVVHCSAGIGRTGTFCTVHSTLEKINLHLKEQPTEPPDFNVLQTVLQMRKQRVGMVQTKEQYVFCYKALWEETQKLGLQNN